MRSSVSSTQGGKEAKCLHHNTGTPLGFCTETVFVFTIVGHSLDLLQQRNKLLSRLADALLQVAYCVGRAAVDVIAAARGLHMMCPLFNMLHSK